VRRVFERLRGVDLPGVVDLVPAYATVLVEFEIDGLDEAEAERAVRAALGMVGEFDAGPGRLVQVPVCYGGEFGPDLEEVARLHSMTARQVAELHSGAEYLVHFIGFVPGFAYMGGLPAVIATGRLERPRARVPAGSLGIAGEQTGVYPFATPGGWRLIGRTPLRMFDARRGSPSLLEMGDRVRFRGVDKAEFEAVAAKGGPSNIRPQATEARADPLLKVVDPGMLTSVQDLGRRGLGAFGVCGGGAADWASLVTGNRTLGNEAGAAGLEMTLRGCVVEFKGESEVVLVGAEASVQGQVNRKMREGEVVGVGAGDRVVVGRFAGARAYLCAAGGVEVPLVLGSRSTHLSAGFGGVGRGLRPGDELGVGLGIGARAMRHRGAGGSGTSVARSGERLLRVVINEGGEFGAGAMKPFLGGEYRVASQSDRVGLRLEGPRIESKSGGRMISEGMMWGAVQIPEDGQPIVLNVDYPVTGGYPVIGCVAAADQPVLGQVKPGDAVRFEVVTRGVARELYRGLKSSMF
jgi:KipI family sensor histidine kinase inhibitor